jgi:hypothetical protein
MPIKIFNVNPCATALMRLRARVTRREVAFQVDTRIQSMQTRENRVGTGTKMKITRTPQCWYILRGGKKGKYNRRNILTVYKLFSGRRL